MRAPQRLAEQGKFCTRGLNDTRSFGGKNLPGLNDTCGTLFWTETDLSANLTPLPGKVYLGKGAIAAISGTTSNQELL